MLFSHGGCFIAQNFIPWLEYDWPIYWDALFIQPGSLVLEIGFGNGGFLIDQARVSPDQNFIGIDSSWPSVERLLDKLTCSHLQNVRVLHGDARAIVARLFEPLSVQNVWINFPDPWPKKRHQSRRLIQPGFVKQITSLLASGGQLNIVTDHAQYAEQIGTVLQGQGNLRSKYATPFVEHLPGRIATKYGCKARADGRSVHYFVWQKCGKDKGFETAAELSRPLAPICFKNGHSGSDFEINFKTHTWQTSHKSTPVFGKVIGFYSRLDTDEQLIEVLVQEGQLTQRIGFSVQRLPNANVEIRLSPIGCPRATWGVRKALQQVGYMILARNSQLTVVSTPVRLKQNHRGAQRSAEGHRALFPHRPEE